MRISTKGQVTIPIEIRAKLGLLPATEVSFVVSDDGVLITKQPAGNRFKLLTKLAGKSTSGLSTDAIMKLTRP